MQGAALIKTAEFVGVGRVFQTFRLLLGHQWDTFIFDADAASKRDGENHILIFKPLNPLALALC